MPAVKTKTKTKTKTTAAVIGLLGMGAAHADLTSTLGSGSFSAPVAIAFSNSAVTTGTVSGVFNFLDTWTFTLLGGANVQALATSFVYDSPLPGYPLTFGISNLDVDLFNSSNTLISAGTTSVVNGTPFTIFTSTTPTTPFAAGAYSLKVRGTIVGQPASYSGNVIAVAPSAVPLPAALPLLLMGLGAIGVTGKRRRHAAAA